MNVPREIENSAAVGDAGSLHTHTHTHSLSLSLSHTHTHIHTLIQIHHPVKNERLLGRMTKLHRLLSFVTESAIKEGRGKPSRAPSPSFILASFILIEIKSQPWVDNYSPVLSVKRRVQPVFKNVVQLKKQQLRIVFGDKKCRSTLVVALEAKRNGEVSPSPPFLGWPFMAPSYPPLQICLLS
ncbi:hypothetical protein E2320_014792 [Naja naja]|nr:hypothetical protein E2320_014792 [Naja naja]